MGDLSLNWQQAVAQQVYPTPQLKTPYVLSNTLYPTGYLKNLQLSNRNQSSSNGSPLSSFGVGVATDYLSKIAGDKLFGDSEFGRGLGTLFSSGISSAGNSMINNLFKEQTLMSGLGQNVGSSLAGAGAGIVSNYIGKGINALGGDSKLSRGIGQGISSGLGTVGGTMLSNLVSSGNIIGNASKLFGTGDSILTTAKTIKDTAGNVATKAAGAINPYALGATVLGTALGAAMGPSKEYGGDYGGVTKTADTIYDMASLGVNFIPGVGQALSGAMALNKGLSNIFGSTSGNTLVDSILGSAFMPAPIKWLNQIGKTTSRSVGNQSWQNTERKNAFIGNAFGNIENRIQEGIKHSNSTQGLFASGATRKFNQEVDFANMATNKLLAMMDQHDLQNIKSQYMSSINNQRYAQDIQGGWNPIYRGKQGMKIFNNQINHNIGQRLLSGAALIDNKAMILSAQGGTKVMRPRMKPHRKGEQPVYTEEEQRQQAEWNAHLEKVRKQQAEEQTRKQKQREEATDKFNQQINTVMEAMTQQANETPFTGQDFQQAAENQRQEKIEKFHEAEKVGEAAMMADLAVSAAPLLQRGFRWAFNKAGQLVKVPIQKTVQETSSVIKPTIRKEYVNSPKDITSDVGELIAEGSERSVYTSKSNPNIVYKIEDGNAALEDINNIKIRSELTDDVIAPESTIGYFKHKNGKYYRVTQQDKYKSFNPDNYDADLSPKLNQEIINTLEKSGWKVEVTDKAARTASKNGKVLRNLEHYNWGRDSQGNLKLIDQDVVEDTRILASLESDYKGKPVILSVPKTMRKADSDVAKMNEYHAANVQEYNQSTGNNVTSIPFRTDYNGRQVKVLPNEEFNIVVRSKNTNAPSGSEQNVGGMYSKNDDTVYLRNTGNPSNNYHEFLHSSRYGETNPEVTQWRIQQLIDEDKVSKMTPQQKAYYISETETPVHLRQQGERMNINVGDPYPGDKAFDKMLNEYGVGGATSYMKRDTSKAKQLLWKAFNGTLFSGLTATTLYNTNK